MKYKTTAKAVRSGYRTILAISYCGAQNLLSFEYPRAYTCGVYGWNFDIYDVDGVAICTGYRGMPKTVSFDYSLLESYEKEAEKLRYSKDENGNFLPRETIEKKIKELLKAFISEVTGE